MGQFVSGNGHPVNESWEPQAARMLALMAQAFCEAHELEHHSEEQCKPARCSLAAFIAFALGVRTPAEHRLMRSLMRDLEAAT